MKFELTEGDLGTVLYATKSNPLQGVQEVRRKLLGQWKEQTNRVVPIVADAAVDGPEVYLIRSFFIFPGGAFGGFEYMKQALSDLWENWS